MYEKLKIVVLGTAACQAKEMQDAFAEAVERVRLINIDAPLVFLSRLSAHIQPLVLDELKKSETAQAVVVLAPDETPQQDLLRQSFGDWAERLDCRELPAGLSPDDTGEYLVQQGNVLLLLSAGADGFDAETAVAVKKAQAEHMPIVRIVNPEERVVNPEPSPRRFAGKAVVRWLIEAHDQFDKALSQAGKFVCCSDEQYRELLKRETERLDDLLRLTFPDAMVIVVLDRMGGYSGRADRHVLRVEVQRMPEEEGGQERTEARMIKIGPCQELCRELAGRKTCERSANSRGALCCVCGRACARTDPALSSFPVRIRPRPPWARSSTRTRITRCAPAGL